LAQVGQDRAGFDSYEWLEDLAGRRMRNAEQVHAEKQERAIGDTVYLHHAYGLPVTRFERDRVLALRAGARSWSNRSRESARGYSREG
jgi:hypothetical protein